MTGSSWRSALVLVEKMKFKKVEWAERIDLWALSVSLLVMMVTSVKLMESQTLSMTYLMWRRTAGDG